MRVVFLGTPDFAVPALEALLQQGHDVRAVVTQPDRPRGRSHSTLIPSPVKRCAERHRIPTLQPERPRGSEFLAALRHTNADLGVVVAYGHVLGPEVIRTPRLGMINVHASILPRWRGAAPIHWAIAAGDTETGVSIMRVEEGLDTGGVWHAVTTPISDTDTTGGLYTRLATLGAGALIAALPRIARGDEPVPQPASGVTHAPKVDRDAARIDWRADAATIARRIRAMDPAPGAWSTYNGDTLKLFGAMATRGSAALEPGVARSEHDALVVGTADGSVTIPEVQPAGRRRMLVGDWLRGGVELTGARFR